MNNMIEQYIGAAMEELEAALVSAQPAVVNEGRLKKEYKGYISSLGASIRMSGLVPALAFYSSKENSAKADRSQVISWIWNVLLQQNAYQTARQSGKTMFQYARMNSTDKTRLEKDILHVSVALKLCIRTFELTK